jgi:hypothetical protein
MEDTATLWYYICSERDVGSVYVSPNETIDDLRKKIHHDAATFFNGCDPKHLILTKVRYTMISTNTDVTNGICWPITPVGGCVLR